MRVRDAAAGYIYIYINIRLVRGKNGEAAGLRGSESSPLCTPMLIHDFFLLPRSGTDNRGKYPRCYRNGVPRHNKTDTTKNTNADRFYGYGEKYITLISNLDFTNI